ncbi:MAG TPA: SDR family oxidoreductase [Novosphingobium sp.]|nr:SDR family oxidoreductase [Novosphingobium sp.]
MSRQRHEAGGALIVGGSGGLGEAIVRRLAADWQYVDFTYFTNATKAAALLDELDEVTSAAAHALDITQEDQLARILNAAHSRSGGLRTIVYASGVNIPQPYVSQIRPEQWTEVVQTELMGFIALVRHALPILRDTRGSIVNIGSVAPHWYVIGDALSAIPKAGTEVLCRALAKEEGRYGVRANTVAPGIMEVGIGGKLMETIHDEGVWNSQKHRTPLRRFGNGEDVAGAVAFLCSSEAGFITGQTVIVDGGLSL